MSEERDVGVSLPCPQSKNRGVSQDDVRPQQQPVRFVGTLLGGGQVSPLVLIAVIVQALGLRSIPHVCAKPPRSTHHRCDSGLVQAHSHSPRAYPVGSAGLPVPSCATWAAVITMVATVSAPGDRRVGRSVPRHVERDQPRSTSCCFSLQASPSSASGRDPAHVMRSRGAPRQPEWKDSSPSSRSISVSSASTEVPRLRPALSVDHVIDAATDGSEHLECASVAVDAALITAALALLGQAVSRIWQARDRRRDEYSKAFATAMEWTEFPYRIARRLSNDAEAVAPIVAAMHESQERICFHTNWLRAVSDDIERAYASLVDAVKTRSEPHIHEAWRRDPAIVPDGMIRRCVRRRCGRRGRRVRQADASRPVCPALRRALALFLSRWRSTTSPGSATSSTTCCHSTRLGSKRIQDATRHLHQLVAGDAAFKGLRPQIVPQGSFATGTAIRPLRKNDGSHVDLVIKLTVRRSVSSTEVLDWLRVKLALDGTFKKRLVPHPRCVRVSYAVDFHLDIVPARRVSTVHQTSPTTTLNLIRLKVPDRTGGWRLQPGRVCQLVQEARPANGR